jgi:cellulose synthase/poly-beta-1,6-N-acetylglucosamine synthase-like glycosyltransferase
VHFATGSFFNFNGTAGVWRKKTIDSIGGWNSRTTVEDMDLSLRSYVGGWKAIYLEDTTCLNEVGERLPQMFCLPACLPASTRFANTCFGCSCLSVAAATACSQLAVQPCFPAS